MAEKKAKAGKTVPEKTVTVRQIRSANRKPEIQAATLRGLALARFAALAPWKTRLRCAA